MKTYFWILIFPPVGILVSGLLVWFLDTKLKTGIDLIGGTILVYQLDPATEVPKNFDMNRMAEVLHRRLDPSGVRFIGVQKVGSNRVQVVLPGVRPAEAKVVQNVISQAGLIEFRILATRRFDGAASAEAERQFPQAPEGYRWVQLGDPREFRSDAQTVVSRDGQHVLVQVNDRSDVTNDDLARAYATTDQRSLPAVGFELTEDGARRFADLTRKHRPLDNGEFQYRLAIILDGKAMSAPSIRSEIHSQGIIEGGERGFSPDRQESLVTILNAGRLPVPLEKEPVEIRSADPPLSRSTISWALAILSCAKLAVVLAVFAWIVLAIIILVRSLWRRVRGGGERQVGENAP